MMDAFAVSPSFVETMKTFLAEMIPADQLRHLRHQLRPGGDGVETVIMVPNYLVDAPEKFALVKRAFYMTHLHQGNEIRLVCPDFGCEEGKCDRVSPTEGLRGVTCGR